MVIQGADIVTAEARDAFRRDGVCRLVGAIDPHALADLERCWQWSMDHPGPLSSGLLRDGSDAHQDLCNPAAMDIYEPVLRATGLAEVVAALWEKPEVWFMYEQVFRKSGGNAGRTPWHQDLPYLAVNGADLAVIWISFDAVPENVALEFVRGSHRGPLYDGSRFDPEDPTLPLYGTGDLPRLPDIEKQRADYDILSFDIEPGDVVVFHPAMLHGGAPTTDECPERRTLTLRFFGEDAVYEPRPGPAGPFFQVWRDSLQPGDAFRHPFFPRLS